MTKSHAVLSKARIQQVFNSIWLSVPNSYPEKPLLLIKDFYSPQTGLYNEGVYHNSLMGLNLLHFSNKLLLSSGTAENVTAEQKAPLSESDSPIEKDEIFESVFYSPRNQKLSMEFLGNVYKSLHLLANSMYQLNFDQENQLFRQKSLSQEWDHQNVDHIAFTSQYYNTPNNDMKLLSNAVAYIFYCNLQGKATEELARRLDLESSQEQDSPSFIRNEHENPFTSSSSALDEFFEGIHLKYWDESCSLYKSLLPSSQQQQKPNSIIKYKAIDHALLLYATLLHHKTASTKGAHASLQRIHLLRGIILDKFQFSAPSQYVDYLYREEQEAAESASLMEKSSHFLWQDVWTLLCLHLSSRYLKIPFSQDAVSYSQHLEHLFSTYYNDKQGFMMNEPVEKGISSWGESLCSFGNDNSLCYLLCKLIHNSALSDDDSQTLNELSQNTRMQSFMTRFESKGIPRMFSEEKGRIQDLFSHKEQDDVTLWVTSETLFSMLHDTAEEFLQE